MCGHSEVVLMLEVRGGWQTMLMMISPWACRSTLPSMPERRNQVPSGFLLGSRFRRLPASHTVGAYGQVLFFSYGQSPALPKSAAWASSCIGISGRSNGQG